ncbi:KilA-N domain-containing protein, partial [Candidatus Woesearchaeota archaeon]|nr:KilA-N domain-containing protein [Candidatus Woesearchaeota archaeon]
MLLSNCYNENYLVRLAYKTFYEFKKGIDKDMKTEVILYSREFDGQVVRQLSKCGYMCATDITRIYNEYRKGTGLSPKELNDYFKLKSTNEFLESLCNELNLLHKNKTDNTPFYSPSSLKMVKRGKNNKGTWLHPYLFVDYAMWLSPEFRAKVVMWVGDQLLHFRNSSGDAFKECNIVLD